MLWPAMAAPRCWTYFQGKMDGEQGDMTMMKPNVFEDMQASF